MTKRQIIVVLSTIGILLLAFAISNFLGKGKERPKKEQVKSVSTVFASKVVLDNSPVILESTGILRAKNRLDLFSEVQGVMEFDQGRFREGNSFRTGETLILIRNESQTASIISQRSQFISTLTSVMPDIRVDFPQNFKAWSDYLELLNPEKALPNLPETENENLKSFLTGRGIYSSFYSVKNAEIVLAKYRLRAPFNGVVTEALVDPGTVIRPGQKLGTYIQPNQYELPVQINLAEVKFLSTGMEVMLQSPALGNKEWTGKVIRINKAIDPNSQMCTIVVGVEGSDLKDGMFLNAELQAREIPNSITLPRSAMVDGNAVYKVQDNKLKLTRVTVVHRGDQEVIITGLKEGEWVLTKVPPGAFEGMEVKVYEQNKVVG
ncbi:efflux RND transporter periplasmic adaptor subunit [Luteibaculum oceani]|uniref:Efflux RND transporter periplasmic adaptor subunit n=1 Tax=Luteibaculum oceani TaxID=1294296 RepID=A0A5C6V1R3_9FLAO|nr:efflux RND transporter periplasmic adaptor subunit [Luteibaculum oceani]TXC76935.1 efflux RND transporter periplasmic adaptor subunit [Luteibaculum oceani]